MSKEKQIEEMAKVIEVTEQIARDAHCGYPSPRMYAKDLYWKGYRKQSEWISVDERLPADRKLVLVSSMDLITKKHGWFYLARYTNLQNDGVRFEDKRWLSEDGGIFGRVTHWMPLPDPPMMKGGAE